ncbi:MAG: S9 family peptidase [Acidimicrobiia bacterium]|nr:S9 family peptidase [Acidimicrobiia bacterium]
MPLTPPPPPPTRRVPQTDVLWGIPVDDPYRWLEDGRDHGVRVWVDAQNARTNAVLRSIPGREPLRRRLSTLLRASSSVGCTTAGNQVFTLERWGGRDQAVLVSRRTDRRSRGRVLVDPAGLARDPTAAVDWYHPSPDGHWLAFGLSRGGDERSTLHVLDVHHARPLRDAIPSTRAASVAWAPDGSGFAYTRYPTVGTVPPGEEEYWRKVYWHDIGQPWEDDELLWDRLPDKAAWANVTASPDGRYLLIHLSIGWSRVDVHLLDRWQGSHTVMMEGIEAVASFEVVGDRLIGLTTLGADRGRVVTAPLHAAWHERWQTVVGEQPRSVMEAVVATSNSILVLSSRDAVAHLDRYAHDGSGRAEVPLPGKGSLAGLSGSRERDEAFLCFTSFTVAPMLLRWSEGHLEPWDTPVADSPAGSTESPTHGEMPGADAGPVPGGRRSGPTPEPVPATRPRSQVAGERHVVEQATYPGLDGTEIPIFLVRHRDTEPSPTTPCVLTAYGGFAITMAPTYSAAVVTVCDLGGIYAVANIRGGAERGEPWHRAGMRQHKQRSFDDFISAADWLVETGRTSRERLAIRGGSNGGLTVGAAITQRPDLCRAVHCAVPLLDMVRYHRFGIARLWMPEYGDPDVPEEFAWLHAYSPYHRVRDGHCYPATLFTTADGDSRVDPLHARKMTARLQRASSCEEHHPVLLRSETGAGHGQGKPLSRQADELADVLAFLTWQLRVRVPARIDDPT